MGRLTDGVVSMVSVVSVVTVVTVVSVVSVVSGHRHGHIENRQQGAGGQAAGGRRQTTNGSLNI